MVKFHAVLLDETRCEFGADIEAENRDEAYSQLTEDYPESKVVQLESTNDTTRREQDMFNHIACGGDWDGDHPINHYYDEDN